jgi:hypothetical protein
MVLIAEERIPYDCVTGSRSATVQASIAQNGRAFGSSAHIFMAFIRLADTAMRRVFSGKLPHLASIRVTVNVIDGSAMASCMTFD